MSIRFITSAIILLTLLINSGVVEARGGRRGGKGKGKVKTFQFPQFENVPEFSLVKQPKDNKTAHIITGSHYSQPFRLGFKLWFICIAHGNPRPTIKWYKDGPELHPKPNTNYYEKLQGKFRLWSKLEIDPATMGDQGEYACLGNNERGSMYKKFKADYTY